MNALKMSVLIALLLAAGTAPAADLGKSAGHDLDSLWKTAQKTYDLEVEDAVVLLESSTVTVGDEGTLVTRVHRVVWVGTSRGIREYADLRVPWNSDTSTLDVELLRTWMDGRWWPGPQVISETAVVPTLPHALDHADDYTSMRETMLLHDGVELPCIMETAYTIAEQGSPAAGADGLFVFPQRDPAVLTELVVRVPHGMHFAWEAMNGAPMADDDDENGVRVLRWMTKKSPALTRPLTSQPAAHEPAVAWSTWADWDTLDAAWKESISAAAVLGPELAAELDAHLAGSLNHLVDTVEFWNESVRPVHYPFRHWRLAPRTADRTWETGYGHPLDRAVLLKAMLEHSTDSQRSRHRVECAPAEHGFGETAPDLPRLSGYDDLYVVTRSGNFVIDVDHGTILSRIPLDVSCRTPFTQTGASGGSRTLRLSLEPHDDGGWQGDGLLIFHESIAVGKRLFDDPDARNTLVENVVGSILTGCEIADITSLATAFRFTVTMPELPLDHLDQPVLALGPWDNGVLDQLPADIHLHDEARTTPLRIPRNLREEVELRLKVDDRSVRAPEAVHMTGATGVFTVETGTEHGWLTVTRTLDLSQPDDGVSLDWNEPNRHVHAASAWPGLRQLLLESREPIHGRIVFED